MDSKSLFYLALIVFWLIFQVAAAAKKAKQKAEEQPAPRPEDVPAPLPRRLPPLRPSPLSADRTSGIRESLDRVEKEIAATLPELDEKVRAQVSFLWQRRFEDERMRIRRALDQNEPGAIGEAHAWLADANALAHAARTHSTLRKRHELREAQAVADRLVEDFYQPQASEPTLPPPVAVFRDVSAGDELGHSPLAPSTLFIPRSVLGNPAHWLLVADLMARYLKAETPELYQEVYDRLDLDVDEAQIGTDLDALTRVLFAAWIHRIFADTVGALFFGPAYLRALARLYAQPEAPARVVSITLNTDGSVGVEPPAHVRVHLAAEWVSRMGYGEEASEITDFWDERHGSPQTFGFRGATTRLPAAAVLTTARGLIAKLATLSLNALGNRRLADVPGLSGFRTHEQDAAVAKSELLAGEIARGAPRALVAGAIDAALDSPEAAASIQAALARSLMSEPRPKARAKRRRRLTKRGRLTGQAVAEALILGDILLDRR